MSKPLSELVDAGRLQLLQSAALAAAERLWSDGEIHLQKQKEVMICWAWDVTKMLGNRLQIKYKWCDGEGFLLIQDFCSYNL